MTKSMETIGRSSVTCRRRLIPVIAGLLVVVLLTGFASAQFDEGFQSSPQEQVEIEDYSQLSPEERQQKIELYQKRIAECRKQIETETAEKEKITRELSTLGSSPVGMNFDVYQSFAIKATDVEIEVQAKEGQLAELEKQIALLSQRAAAQAQQDEIIQKLQEIIRLKKDAVAMAEKMYEKGTLGNPMELNQAKIQLAETEIQLATRKNELAEKGTMEIAGKLNEQLVQCCVELAEQKARKEAIDKRLKQIPQLMALDSQKTQCSMRAGQLDAEIEDLQYRIDKLNGLPGKPTRGMMGGGYGGGMW